jgi:hypothetical protein
VNINIKSHGLSSCSPLGSDLYNFYNLNYSFGFISQLVEKMDAFFKNVIPLFSQGQALRKQESSPLRHSRGSGNPVKMGSGLAFCHITPYFHL